MTWKACCVLLAMGLFAGTNAEPIVSGVSPNLGGVHGGQRITIKGREFAENSFNFGPGKEHLGNKVKLVSGTQEYDGDIHQDGCTEVQIMFYTRKMPEGSYYVRVYVDDVAVPLGNHCNNAEGKSADCRIDIKESKTPTIDTLTPRTGPAGSIVTMRGTIFTTKFSSNENDSPNGDPSKITRVYAGGQPCNLRGDGLEFDTYYGLSLDAENSNYGTMACKLTGTYVGNQNVSYLIDGEHGRAKHRAETMRYNSFDKLAMFQTYAEISGVSQSQGSVYGNQLLTISGSNFDDTDAPPQVLVGGVPCDVTDLQDTQIICSTAAEASKAAWAGNRGVFMEFWNDTTSYNTDMADLVNLTSPQDSWWVPESSYVDENGANDAYVTRMRGWFIPPTTNSYTFFVKADDSAVLYFSDTEDPADMVQIAECASATTDYENNDDQKSAKMTLNAGERYYLEASAKEILGDSHVYIAVHMHDTAFTSKQSGMVKDERQRITTSSTVVNEIQDVTLTNTATSSPVKEIQEIVVTSNNPGSAIFRFGMDGVYTMPITLGTTISDIQTGLRFLPSIAPEGVTVSASDVSNGRKYSVQFDSDRGDWPELDCIRDDNSDGSVSCSVTEKTKGVASGKYLVLSLEGVKAPPVAIAGITAQSLQSALDTQSGIRCPHSLTNTMAWTFLQDYEGSRQGIETGSRTTEFAPLCGKTATVNPRCIFCAEWNDIRARYEPVADFFRQKHFCFGYNGPIQPHIIVRHKYQIAGESGATDTWTKFEVDYETTEGWHYICIDIGTQLIEMFANQGRTLIKAEVIRVVIERAAGDDLLVDHVGITAEAPTDDPAGMIKYERLQLPRRAIDSVAVSENTPGTFTINITPLECAYNFGMFTVEQLQAQSEVTVTRVTSASPPVAGTFSLTHNGVTLTFPADVEEEDLLAKLETIPGMGQLHVERNGKCSGYKWDVYWRTKGGDKEEMVLDGSSLTGNEVESSIVTKQEGGVFMNPIPGDMLRSYHAEPQVTVSINKIPSVCTGDCSYNWDAASSPTITAVTPISGSAVASTELTITGTNFDDSSMSNNVVMIGGVACDVTAATTTSIECDIGEGPAGQWDVSVNTPSGEAGHISGPHQFSYTFSISGISPSSGSSGGGTSLTVSGTGFGSSVSASVGGSVCTIVTSDYDTLVCVTPSTSSAGAVDVIVSQGATTTTSPTQFTYDAALTAVITSIDTTSAQVEGGTEVTITGTDFGASGSIQVNGRDATIELYSDTSVVATLPDNEPGSYPLRLTAENNGWADITTNSIPDISYALEITNVFPLHGSMLGGAIVTISGSGFSTTDANNEIKFGDAPCDVISSTNSQVTCVMGDPGTVHTVNNDGEHPVHGKGFAWSPNYIEVSVGDYIEFSWAVSDLLDDDIGIRVESVADPVDKVYGGAGFQSPAAKSKSGTFRHQFNSIGKYNYWSGCVDDFCTIGIRGVVSVVSKASFTADMSFKIGGHEAVYNTASGVSNPVDSSVCPGDISVSCSGPEPTDSSKFSFRYWSCLTASVSSVTPNEGTAVDSINIQGSGFSTTACQNEVTIGGNPCTVTAATSTGLTCSLDGSSNIDVGTPMPIDVKMSNRGTAKLTDNSNYNRMFTLKPHVDSIVPDVGSLNGLTLITITGSGFTKASKKRSTDLTQIQVVNGQSQCDVKEVSYSQIICETASANPSTNDISVGVNVDGSAVMAECSGTCSYQYSSTATPSVSSVSPTSVSSANEVITITGSGFGTNTADVAVSIGTTTCTLTAVTNTQITCNAGEPIVGNQAVAVTVSGVGLATSSSTVAVSATISSMAPTSGSLNGGDTLVIAGFGFDDDASVDVGGSDCSLVSVTNSQIECTLPSGAEGAENVVVTSNSVDYPAQTYTYASAETPTLTGISPSSGISSDTLTISGTKFGSSSADVIVTINSVECAASAVSDTSITCTAGANSAGTYDVSVNVVGKGLASGDVDFEYELAVNSVTANEGSFAGGHLITVAGRGFETVIEDMNATVCGDPCAIQTGATITSFQCETPANTGSGDVSCDVVVSSPNSVSTLSSAYTYRDNLTPSISSVSPRRGGTAGGTTVTISGSGLGTQQSDVSVTIGGSDCIISSYSTSQIVCVTEPRKPSTKTKVRVAVEGKGIATQDNADYEYVDLWSSPFTWGNNPIPAEGELVVIPSDMTVMLDVDTPVLAAIIIQGGQLIFDAVDVELQANFILITDGGLLQVGTEAEPFQHKAIITLHGHQRSPELPIYGTKMIGVRDGTLELHGKHKGITWTRLASTAAAGATTITLEKAVEWEVGDEIVIATTGHRHSQGESEQRTITAISGDKMTLTLDSALEYKHLGETIQIGSTTTLEARAEIGLLTHNVVFRGNDDPSWNGEIEACEEGFDTGEFATQTCFQGRFGEEIGSSEFGAHILIHPPAVDAGVAHARIENVELTFVGQAFRLGRYAIHFHLVGRVPDSYVRFNSIHRSFNRATNVHDTHELTIAHNVGFNIMGGAFFTEDGIETGNVFEYNLAIFVKQTTSLQNDDITPAAFWSTNPNNTIRHNAAAGGTHFAFWYRMHEHPDGPSFDANICQQHVELGEFRNNTGHSFGWFGFWMFTDYFPMEGGCCDCNNPIAAKFYGLTAWNCEKGAEWVGAGALQLHDFLMVNNEKAGIEGKFVRAGKSIPYDAERGPRIVNTVIAARGPTVDSLDGATTARGIILPQGQGLVMEGVTFVNFADSGSACYSVCSIDGTTQDNCGGFQYRVEGSVFDNSPNKVHYRWLHEAWFLDVDGTFTGVTGGTVIPDNPSLPPSCSVNSEFTSNARVPGAVCPADVKWHRLAFNNFAPSSLDGHNVRITTEHGSVEQIFLEKSVSHAKGWEFIVQDSTVSVLEFVDMTQVSSNMSYKGMMYDFEEGEFAIISHNLTSTQPDMFTITGDFRNESEATLAASDNIYGDWTFIEETGMYSYIVSGKTTETTTLDVGEIVNKQVQMQVYKCFYEGCELPIDPSTLPPLDKRPDTAVYWSDTESWSNVEEGYGGNYGNGDYGLPLEGDDIFISNDTWMVMDVENLPAFGQVWVEGVLEFEGNPIPASRRKKRATEEYMDLVLSCTHMLVSGRLIVGWPEDPFKGTAEIRLLGNHFTPELTIPGPNVGSKAMGVFGGLDLHGAPRTTSWTRLSATATAGSTIITVADTPDWVVDDEIVIATTSYRADETETATITAISGNSITFTPALQFDHTYNVQDLGDGRTHTMTAEVGLLTRNVKIIGEEYPNQLDEVFGGRILISSFANDGYTYTGYGRIRDVEFVHGGQDGWVEDYDPRFALAYLNTGENTEIKPSYVRNCAFHHGYGTAIGLFGAIGIPVEDNVIHRTVGASIKAGSGSHEFRRNLVTWMQNAGTFNGKEVKQLFNPSAFELHTGDDFTLEDNVVAGTDRGGYRIDGEMCALAGKYINNEVHSGLYAGVDINEDGTPPCTTVANFIIWRFYDYGVYIHTDSSVEVHNIISIDNTIGVFPEIYGPKSLAHETSEKYFLIKDSVFVGGSDSYVCDKGYSMGDPNFKASKSTRGIKTPSGGDVGATFCSFMSGVNGNPIEPWAGSITYQAINGITRLEGVTFTNYGTTCGREFAAVMTSSNMEDNLHPMVTEGISFSNVFSKNKVYFERASLGKINPADCVDMECDGKKKAVIEDTDGSFLGSAGAIISQAEYEWDGDPRRGLGDYRIPNAMISNSDGTQIDIDTLAPKKGIYRGNNNCQYVDDWQAYECHGLTYRMLHLESLDSDTETRRLSPIALHAGSYVDLINGPQDHGWCSGYTCQKRLSLFPFIVATGLDYQLFYTGTSPQDSRLHLLNSDENDAVSIGIFYTELWRMDIYIGDTYVDPKNAEYNDEGRLIMKSPSYEGEYNPDVNSDPTGTNFFDRDTGMLHVLVRGPTPITIITTDEVFFSFDTPTQTTDDFFGPNLVSNIATFLGISSDKIRVAFAVREDSRRKRESVITVDVTISNAPRNLTDVDPNDLSAEELQALADQLVLAFQLGQLADVFDLEILSFTLTEPVPGSDTELWTMYANLEIDPSTDLQVPIELDFHTDLVSQHEGVPFSTQPKVIMKDHQGDTVGQLGSNNDPWVLGAFMTAIDSDYSEAELTGITEITHFDGAFEFTNLGISHPGLYEIEFLITHPAAATGFMLSSQRITVDHRPLMGSFIYHPDTAIVEQTFGSYIQIVDENTEDIVTDIDWKGHSWTCEVSVYMPEICPGDVSGSLVDSVHSASGTVNFTALSISSYGQYYLNYHFKSSPADYDFSLVSSAITVYPANYVPPASDVSKSVQLKFDADFDSVVADKDMYFGTAIFNKLWAKYSNVTFSNFIITKGSIMVAFTISGSTDAVEPVLDSIWEDLKEPMAINFGGYEVESVKEMWVEGETFTGNDGPEVAPVKGLHPGIYAAVAIAGVAIIALIIGVVAYKYKHRSKENVKLGTISPEVHRKEVQKKLKKQGAEKRRETVYMGSMDHNEAMMAVRANTDMSVMSEEILEADDNISTSSGEQSENSKTPIIKPQTPMSPQIPPTPSSARNITTLFVDERQLDLRSPTNLRAAKPHYTGLMTQNSSGDGFETNRSDSPNTPRAAVPNVDSMYE